MSDRGLEGIADQLRAGGIAIVPTDTAYALAADATNVRAIRVVRRLKGRGQKPIALLAADRAQVARFFNLSTAERRLARQFWPGPLTLVLTPRRAKLPVKALSPSGRVGVRVPTLAVARRLANLVSRPLTATSANRSGQGECYSVGAARRSLGVDVLAYDVGRLPKRKPSTVVELLGERVVVHRRGPVVIE